MKRTPGKVFFDPRSFGAIGFQDLWLNMQGYTPSSHVLKFLTDAAIHNQVHVTALTTEDGRVIAGFPEDRFGFVAAQVNKLPNGYKGDLVDENLLEVTKRGYSPVYFINSQTVHSPDNKWAGLKVQVIGSNKLSAPSAGQLSRTVRRWSDLGLVTLLCDVAQSDIANALVSENLPKPHAILAYDANNSLPPMIPHIHKWPIEDLWKRSRSRNVEAAEFARDMGLPAVAASSSHWFDQMGSAGIELDYAKISGTPEFCASLRESLSSGKFKVVRGYNNPIEVLKFGYLLGKYGMHPDRFRGMRSSYNQPE